jgi:6-phosphogluconolactonase (cycloisomerase 2 family)
LGEDAVYHYGFDDAVGRLTCQGATRLERGKGPRHVVFHPSRKAAFVVQELSSTVSAFVYDDAAPAGMLETTDPRACLKLTQCVSTLPDGYDNAHHCVNGCVEINERFGCTDNSSLSHFLAMTRPSCEEPASPRHRAGVASMAWRTTR